MPEVRTLQRLEREPDDVEARIIEAIQSVGPRNVSKLSKLIGIHPETVRYDIHKRFRRLGFHVHAEVDYRKLGLIPHWAELRLAPAFCGTPRSVLLAMNESAYLVYYGKLLPQGSFVCLFAIPEGRKKEHEAFLAFLKRKGVLLGYDLNEIAATRHPTMQPKYFNFQSNRWDIDWNHVRLSQGVALKAERRSPPARIDYSDLLLVKELQVDALQHTASIAKKVRVHEKTLEYHYRVHLQKEKLISGYLVRWQHDIETSAAHNTLMARLTFRNLGNSVKTVQMVISKIPFVWNEDLMSDGTYIATVHIPVQETTSTFDYLNSQIPDLYGKVELSFVKKSEASAFTIPYQLYDKDWKYDLKKITSSFKHLR